MPSCFLECQYEDMAAQVQLSWAMGRRPRSAYNKPDQVFFQNFLHFRFYIYCYEGLCFITELSATL
jgi:hypothetical protein